MQCPECKESLPANAQFCTNCGLRVAGAATGATQRLDTAASQKCGKCGGLMERGFIPDEFRDRNEVTVWVRGVPARSSSTGALDLGGVQMWQVVTLRCTICGYLESYAIDTLGGV
jgi:Double zinc ribbon